MLRNNELKFEYTFGSIYIYKTTKLTQVQVSKPGYRQLLCSSLQDDTEKYSTSICITISI